MPGKILNYTEVNVTLLHFRKKFKDAKVVKDELSFSNLYDTDSMIEIGKEKPHKGGIFIYYVVLQIKHR